MRYLSAALLLALLAGLSLLPANRSEAADDEKDWSTIKGRIVFDGDKVPEPEELKIDKDQGHCLEKGKLFNETWVVNKNNKGVRWVFAAYLFVILLGVAYVTVLAALGR